MSEEKRTRLDEEKKIFDSVDNLGNMYNFRNDFKYSYKTDAGLTPDIVQEISEKKDEPKWMRDFRLKSLDITIKCRTRWAPDISGLDIQYRHLCPS